MFYELKGCQLCRMNRVVTICPKYITYRTALHNRLQEANLDDTNFTVKMEFLFSSCKTIITLAFFPKTSCLN